MITRARLLLGAATLLALLVVPVALAASDGSSGTQATASGVKGKVKKLTAQVKQLEARLAALEGQQGEPVPPPGGATGQPSGPAGGDLTGTYPNPSIATDAVGSLNVEGNSLTGADIDESSLGQVPSALSANSANTANIANIASSATNATNALTSTNVDGVSLRAFNFDDTTSGTNTTILQVGGLTLQADCDPGPNVEIFATTNANNSYLFALATNTAGTSTNTVRDTNFVVGQQHEVQVAGNGTGSLTYRQSFEATSQTSQDVITVAYSYEENLPAAFVNECQVMGTAIVGGD